MIGAIDQLSTMDVAVGKCYALADPKAPTVRELVGRSAPCWTRSRSGCVFH